MTAGLQTIQDVTERRISSLGQEPAQRGRRRQRAAHNAVLAARVTRTGQRYFSTRIDGVKVTPINNPSGAKKRLTVWPHGSFLFLTSIR